MSEKKKEETGVDYKVEGADCSLKELCGFFKKFVSLQDGSLWQQYQATFKGNKSMTQLQRMTVMTELEPVLAPLFYILEKKKDGRETCVGYFGFENNAGSIVFIQNNVMKLVRGCLQALGDLGKMKRQLDRMKERAKDNDMISMTEHREIVKGLQDEVDELRKSK